MRYDTAFLISAVAVAAGFFSFILLSVCVWKLRRHSRPKLDHEAKRRCLLWARVALGTQVVLVATIAAFLWALLVVFTSPL